MVLEYLVAGQVLVTLVVGGLLVRWILALQGTVKAQDATIKTLGAVNDTA